MHVLLVPASAPGHRPTSSKQGTALCNPSLGATQLHEQNRIHSAMHQMCSYHLVEQVHQIAGLALCRDSLVHQSACQPIALYSLQVGQVVGILLFVDDMIQITSCEQAKQSCRHCSRERA